MAKHALPKKEPAQAYTVQATHQFAITPCFCTMGIAKLMQIAVGIYHFILYPCAVLPLSFLRFTIVYYGSKVLVDGEFKSLPFQQSLHAFAHNQLVGQ